MAAPDYKTATLDVLRANATVVGQLPSASNIAGTLPETAGTNPVRWITVEKAGGLGKQGPHWRPRLQLRTYGASAFDAMLLWRYVADVLEPPNQGINGWKTAKGARVLDATIGEPIEFIENNWYGTQSDVLLRVLDVAVT